MKHLLSFFSCIFLYMLFPISVSAQLMRMLTKQEALDLAKAQFSEQDVDFYLVKDSNSQFWQIFVDAEPLKGWEHSCYMLYFPKNVSANVSNILPLKKSLRLAPSGDLENLSVKDRSGNKVNEKPYVSESKLTNEAINVAQHTYAVILSGGINKNMNHERYWNDCSFIYQVLTRKFGVPKSNINVIMSDGNNPAEDMRTISGEYTSSPLDLDGDGNNEIEYSATRGNVQSVLNTLSNKLQEDDHLLFFVIDHGGSKDYLSKSYIWLWNGEVLYDYELANWLTPVLNKKAVVNCILGQCYSGGFIDDLTKKGCIVSTASTGRESSYATSDLIYDEFVYQWTSAVNEKDTYNHKILSDFDNNGYVSMNEAFAYAKTNDRQPNEHPQFVSTPSSIGEDLGFNHLAPAIDLYIKDNVEDTGKEPNTSTDKFWDSPSIWVRNNADSIEEHENPYYSSDHLAAAVYVKIDNRGREDFPGGKWLHVYWAKASTGLTDKAWKGRELYNGTIPTGGSLPPKYIGSINAGEERLLQVTWGLPDLLQFGDGPDKHHFCLIARIMDSYEDDGYEAAKRYFKVSQSNDQAQKNVSIICKEDALNGTIVYVRNTCDTTQNYTLELVPRTQTDAKLYTICSIEMSMSPVVSKAWERGGKKSSDISILQPAANNGYERVRFNSSSSKLENINLKKGEFDKIVMKFDFSQAKLGFTSDRYTFDLIQKDDKGNIIGGETFIVESPILGLDTIFINKSLTPDGSKLLSIDTTDVKSVRWNKSNGQEIGDSCSIMLPASSFDKIRVTSVSKQGEMATGTTNLREYIGFKNLSFNSEGDILLVEIYEDGLPTHKLVIRSVSNTKELLTSNMPEKNYEARLNISQLPSDTYVLSLYAPNNKLLESRTIVIR